MNKNLDKSAWEQFSVGILKICNQKHDLFTWQWTDSTISCLLYYDWLSNFGSSTEMHS